MFIVIASLLSRIVVAERGGLEAGAGKGPAGHFQDPVSLNAYTQLSDDSPRAVARLHHRLPPREGVRRGAVPLPPFRDRTTARDRTGQLAPAIREFFALDFSEFGLTAGLVARPRSCKMQRMQLPIVDQFRQPFIEPLGHLVMFAAKADNELVRMVCAARGETIGASVVAHELRNWTADAKAYVLAALKEIADDELRTRAVALIDTFESLRDRRHRAVHDSWEVGVFGSEEEGYQVRPLRVGFIRQDKATTFENIVEVTAGEIAALACEYADLAQDIEAITYMLGR